MILSRTHPPITLHDLDIYFSERGEEDRADFQHIGITYNINHGVRMAKMVVVVFGSGRLFKKNFLDSRFKFLGQEVAMKTPSLLRTPPNQGRILLSFSSNTQSD